MKSQFQVVCLLLGLAAVRSDAASSFYVNDGVVLCPPQIPPQVDATNFVNNSYFSINFTNSLLVSLQQLYTTANTRNFTNHGMMIANSGFRFDHSPPGAGTHTMASSFVNEGTISCGSADNTNQFFGLFLLTPGLPKLQISATNVSLRSSTNIVGVDGNFVLTGKNVDLNRARIQMEGFEDTPTNLFTFFFNLFPVGMGAGYWGFGTNVMSPVFEFEVPPPTTPSHLVTLPGGFISFQQLVGPNATFYEQEFINGTNRFVQAVFVNNTNPAVANNVYFPFRGVAVVEWLGRQTNLVSGVVTTNRLYLEDDFGLFGTNTVINNFNYYSAAPVAIPINYSFTLFPPFFFGLGTPSPPTSPAGVFDPVLVTNEFAAFGGLFSPSSVSLADLPPTGRYLTNLPGRIEINAERTLDLSRARITGLNYLGLKATNHVISTDGAKISVPFSDISLGTTNGKLSITNLLFPVVQRFNGEVDVWSGRWTNDFGGFHSTYSVLFVDSRLKATAPSQIQDLTLRSTNIVISDILNVTRNLMLDVERLTITTNQQPAATTRGEINLNSSAITWSTSTPRLQYLTNDGAISSLNAVFFGGSRSSPFYTSNFNEPYLAFVNRGQVNTEGSLIWASYFENTGLFSTATGFGSIALTSQTARLTNGTFVALHGDITINSGDLIITNHTLQTGGRLSLSATNLLTDTATNQFPGTLLTNVNTWTAKGISLTAKPLLGDLLGTTIFSTAPAFAEVVDTWAGENRGCSTAGFTNDVAIGRLILDGGDDSLFTFTGAGNSNAIYIDYLELRNFMTNRDAGGNFIGLQIDPNMKVYFAQAMANGVSIAEKLDQQNGGRFCWVSDYAGFYSGTNIVYPDGSTNYFNAALIGSCNLDSDGDGLVNCSDTTPILRPQDVALSVSMLIAPVPTVEVSWQSRPFAANTVYYKTSPSGGNWQVLTNFVSGPLGGRVSIVDPVSQANPRYYRVRVDSYQP